MKLIIDIAEGRYSWIMSHASNDPRDYTDGEDLVFRKAVESGTVLPKGHGDLIDRQSLIDSGVEKGFCDWYDEIKNAPTIVKADKEAEDE